MVKDLYPFKSNFLDIGGLKYHYVDQGEGDPVVMVHGNPTWSFYYRNLIQALCGSFRVIAPDHMGCGLSDKPGDDKYEYTLERRVQDLERLLDHLNIKKDITLIVHDWGGMIGFAYGVRHPDSIKKLVVMNTSCFRLPPTKPFPWPLWLGRNTLLGGFLIRGLNAFCVCAVSLCCKRKKLDRETARQYLAPYDSWRNRIAVLRFVQDIPLKPGDRSYDLVAQVENLSHKLAGKPMLILWGERDFVFDLHFLEEWKKRFPDARVHSFADAGHYILEDAEEAIPLITEFIRENPIERDPDG